MLYPRKSSLPSLSTVVSVTPGIPSSLLERKPVASPFLAFHWLRAANDRPIGFREAVAVDWPM